MSRDGDVHTKQPILVGNMQQVLELSNHLIRSMLCTCISCRSTSTRNVDDDDCEQVQGNIVEFRRPHMTEVAFSIEDLGSSTKLKMSKGVDSIEAILVCVASILCVKG